MLSKFPFKEYLAPGVLLAASAAWFAIQQWLQIQSWWSVMPWGLFTICILLFMAGAVYAGLVDRSSQLRRWIKARKRSFDATVFSRIKSDERKEWLELVARLRFKRTIKRSSIALFAYDCVQFALTRKPNLIGTTPVRDYAKDESVDIVIACVPHYLQTNEPRRHTLWGSTPGENHLVEEAKTITSQSDNLAEIRIGSGRFGPQTFRVFFAMTDGRPDTGGTFFFIPEDRNVCFQ